MQEICARLANLARDNDVAVLATHHLSKRTHLMRNLPVSLDDLRGSTVIGAMARVVWGIDRPAGSENVRRLSMVKSNLTKFPEPLGFEVTEEGVIWCEAPTEPRQETIIDRAAEFLRATLQRGPRPAATIFEEARQAGHSERTIQRAKEKLRVVSVKTSGGWTWSLPGREEHWTEKYDK